MSTPNMIRTVAVIVSATWTAVVYLSGIELPTGAEQVVANIPTVIVVLAVAFDLWLWRLPLIGRLHGRPRIYGSWHTIIEPHINSRIPEGGNTGPIEARTNIEQTFWTLSIIMKTDESESISRVAHIESDGGSKTRKVLVYTYTSTPRLAVRDRSPIHVGATTLTIEGPNPGKMTGCYWTDRLTVGDLRLTRAAS